MTPIYQPKGKAAEYADLALNIYTGCTNGCSYCYAPGVLRKTREDFEQDVSARDGLIDALARQLASSTFEDATVHLCFTCDPYPALVDRSATRKVIAMLKEAGCHVQILTKNPGFSVQDWDLLDDRDWVGTTYTGDDGEEPNAQPQRERLRWLSEAKKQGLRTWVSCEPVLDPDAVYDLIKAADYIDLFKIGKLNNHESSIDWALVGHAAKRLCEEYGRNYLLKDSLMEEMERGV